MKKKQTKITRKEAIKKFGKYARFKRYIFYFFNYLLGFKLKRVTNGFEPS